MTKCRRLRLIPQLQIPQLSIPCRKKPGPNPARQLPFFRISFFGDYFTSLSFCIFIYWYIFGQTPINTLSAVSYYLTLPFLYLLSILPFPLLYILSDLCYVLIYYVIGYRKKIVVQNLQRSFPHK